MQRASPGIHAEEFRAIHVCGCLNAVSNAVSLLVSGADGNYTSAYRSAGRQAEQELHAGKGNNRCATQVLPDKNLAVKLPVYKRIFHHVACLTSRDRMHTKSRLRIATSDSWHSLPVTLTELSILWPLFSALFGLDCGSPAYILNKERESSGSSSSLQKQQEDDMK